MSDSPHDSSGARAAVLTGAGRGAISVVQVWGGKALDVVSDLFRPMRGGPLSGTAEGRPRFGRFGDGRGDEVIAVVVRDNPARVEIQGHGGIAATRLVVDALAARGVEIVARVPPSIGGRRRTRADEAAVDLATAPTLGTAQTFLDQCEGALDREIAALRRELKANRPEALRRIKALLGRAEVGLRLASGWRIVLTGRPNVGKSLLLNALAGFDRAIVSPVAGTTRDVVTARTAIDGWPVEMADTAGLHPSRHDLESAGIALARSRIADADLALIVLDRSLPLRDEDRAAIAANPGGLLVANKSDLAPSWDAVDLGAVPVSAATGEGLGALLDGIAGRLVPDPPEPGAGVPFRERQVEALRRLERLASR